MILALVLSLILTGCGAANSETHAGTSGESAGESRSGESGQDNNDYAAMSEADPSVTSSGAEGTSGDKPAGKEGNGGPNASGTAPGEGRSDEKPAGQAGSADPKSSETSSGWEGEVYELIPDRETDENSYGSESLNYDASQYTYVAEGEYYYDVASVVLYLDEYGELPDNYITKDEARDLGWQGGSVEQFVDGAAIGGDYFGNYERILPVGKGIRYYEADCYYTGGRRNAFRIIYSSDGRVWYTEDHYNTFTELFPSVPGAVTGPSPGV